jgi:hypothetical protein
MGFSLSCPRKHDSLSKLSPNNCLETSFKHTRPAEWDQPAESIHPGSHLDDRLDKTREVCYVLVKRGREKLYSNVTKTDVKEQVFLAGI